MDQSETFLSDLEEIKTLEQLPIKWILRASTLCKKLDQSDMSQEVFDAYEYLSHYDISVARITGVTSAAGVAQRVYKESMADFKAYKAGMNDLAESKEKVINRTCCVIAETPDELGGDPEEAYSWIKARIQDAIIQGYRVFIIGCDIGCGCVAAETVLNARNEITDIRFISAEPELPRERDKQLDFSWSKRIGSVVNQANYRRYITCKAYDPNGLFERNKWIVEHSQCVIVLNGGSMDEIVRYAEGLNKTMRCYSAQL